MYLERFFLDLIDPFMFPSMLLLEAAVVIVEAVVIFFSMDRKAVKAFVASFCANLITAALSVLYIILPLESGFAYSRIGVDAFSLETSTIVLMLLLGLVVNILVEAGVLRLFYKTATARKILYVSTVMNLISYVIVIVNLILTFG